MKNFVAYITVALVALIPVGVFAQSGDPLEVEFNPDPIFTNPDAMPGDTDQGSITATNNTETEQDLYIRFLEESQSGDLGDVIVITVADSEGSAVESQSLNDWFADDQVFLNSFGEGDALSFDISAVFEETSGNEYQNGYVDFDICVGFSGGDEVCMFEEEDDDPEDETTTNTPPTQFEPESDPEPERDPEEDPEEDPDDDQEDQPLGDPGDEPPFALETPGGGDDEPELAQTDPEGDGLGEQDTEETTDEEEEDEEQETQAAAAFLGLPSDLAEAVMCISYFFLILLLIVLLTIPFDSIRNAKYLPRYERVTGRIVFADTLALFATALALVVPALYCTFVFLFITTVAGVLWFAFEDRRLADEY